MRWKLLELRGRKDRCIFILQVIHIGALIEDFCYGYETTTEDVMIILGDAGINYWLDLSDKELKGRLSGMDITFFCVHGNYEARPCEAAEYEEKIWNEGIVYVEEQYPNILFAKDGEIYNFNGKKVMPIGGAYSIDKYYRIRNGLPWFETEQPDEAIKEYVESGVWIMFEEYDEIM